MPMLHRFFKDSTIYVVPVVLSRGIGLLLLPVYTRYLSPTEYGVLEILGIAYALLNLLLPLEISQAVARLLPEADATKKIRYASTSFWYTAIVFSGFAAMVWMFPATAGNLFFGRTGYEHMVGIGVLAMVPNALFYVVQNQLRWNLQSKESAIVSIVYSVVMAVVAVTLVALFRFGIYGYILGQLSASLIALLLGLYYSRDKIPLRLSFDGLLLKEMLAFSAPLVFSGLAVYLNQYTDRWVLREFLGIDEVGIYGVAYRIASITALAIIAFQMAITPLVYKHYKEPDTAQTVGRIFSYFLLVSLPLVGFIGAFSAEIVSIIATTTFQSADRLAPWLAMAVILMGIYVFAPGLGIAKKTGLIAVINVVAAGTNIALNFTLVPIYGAVGAAFATLCGGAIMASLYFWIASRFYAVAYRKWRGISALIFTLLFLALATSNMQIDMEIRALAWILFTLFIFASQTNQTDWREFTGYLRSKK